MAISKECPEEAVIRPGTRIFEPPGRETESYEALITILMVVK